MSKALGIVQRVLSTHLINKAGFIRATAPTGAVTYRIAVGPQQGRKVFTLQTLPPDEDSLGGTPLCRYVSWPAESEKRLALISNGNIRYQPGPPR